MRLNKRVSKSKQRIDRTFFTFCTSSSSSSVKGLEEKQSNLSPSPRLLFLLFVFSFSVTELESEFPFQQLHGTYAFTSSRKIPRKRQKKDRQRDDSDKEEGVEKFQSHHHPHQNHHLMSMRYGMMPLMMWEEGRVQVSEKEQENDTGREMTVRKMTETDS